MEWTSRHGDEVCLWEARAQLQARPKDVTHSASRPFCLFKLTTCRAASTSLLCYWMPVFSRHPSLRWWGCAVQATWELRHIGSTRWKLSLEAVLHSLLQGTRAATVPCPWMGSVKPGLCLAWLCPSVFSAGSVFCLSPLDLA